MSETITQFHPYWYAGWSFLQEQRIL